MDYLLVVVPRVTHATLQVLLCQIKIATKIGNLCELLQGIRYHPQVVRHAGFEC